LNVFQHFSPVLPDNFRDSEYVFLANIDPVLQLKVLDQVQKPKLVAMDTMNFWITGKRAELLKVLERVDMLMINDSEARQLSGEVNLVKAAKKIRAMGPKHLMLKQGEYGALLFSGDEVFRAAAYPLESVFDPTGAGDTFAGGVMGYLAANGAGTSELKKAVVAGSVMASFVVEDFSIDRMRRLSQADILSRFKSFHSLTHFDDVLKLPKV
jgi:sugar/nucleoside kinase (ribokinase family)